MALGLNTTVAPDYLNRWSEKLKVIIDGLTSPRTKFVDTAADLPDPRLWNTRMIWCLDVGVGEKRLCISDGVNWYRTDTGAPV